MSIRIDCDECFMELNVPEKYAGRKIRCRHCQAAVLVPDADEAGSLEHSTPAPRLPRVPAAASKPQPKRKKKKSSKPARSWSFNGVPPGVILLVCLGLCGVPFYLANSRSVEIGNLSTFLALSGSGLWLAAWGGAILLATQESVLTFIGSVILGPLFILYGALTNSERYGGVAAALVLSFILSTVSKQMGGVPEVAAAASGSAAALGNASVPMVEQPTGQMPGQPAGRFDLAGWPVFPPAWNSANFRRMEGDGFEAHELINQDLRALAGQGDGANHPGGRMQLRLYLPAGEHSPGSLPCVLVPPAGTNLISGSTMDDGLDNPEHILWVRAGFAVVTFSLDGAAPVSQFASDADYAVSYRKFLAAQAGLVNAKTAFEFAAREIPAVDDNRIYIAGHSSAGTLALLFAAHEPNSHGTSLAGCIAFAPETDVEAFLKPVTNQLSQQMFPGIRQFLVRSSPKSHTEHFRCPVFLFHVRGDSVVPYAHSSSFNQQLKALNREITFITGQGSDHYYTMVNQGIPAAIRWLASGTGADPAATAGSVTPPPGGTALGVPSTSPPSTSFPSPAGGNQPPGSAAASLAAGLGIELPQPAASAAGSSAAGSWQDDSRAEEPRGTKAVRSLRNLKPGTVVFARGRTGSWEPAEVVKVDRNVRATVQSLRFASRPTGTVTRPQVRLPLTADEVPASEQVVREFEYSRFSGQDSEPLAAAEEKLRTLRGYLAGTLSVDEASQRISYTAVKHSEADARGRISLLQARFMIRSAR